MFMSPLLTCFVCATLAFVHCVVLECMIYTNIRTIHDPPKKAGFNEAVKFNIAASICLYLEWLAFPVLLSDPALNS